MLASLLTLGLSAFAYAIPTTELVQRAGPDLSQVFLHMVSWDGTGCPKESNNVGNYTSSDKQTLTLEFDNFVASIGPGVAPSEWRKNCQLNILLHYPQGFQYSILDTIYRGYVAIDVGVTAKQEALYYFSGESAQSSCELDFTGPHSDDYTKEVPISLSSIVWSPCGTQTALNIDASVQLHSTVSSATGQMTIDSEDENVKFIIGLQWRKC